VRYDGGEGEQRLCFCSLHAIDSSKLERAMSWQRHPSFLAGFRSATSASSSFSRSHFIFTE
jgi:hypothetical protein